MHLTRFWLVEKQSATVRTHTCALSWTSPFKERDIVPFAKPSADISAASFMVTENLRKRGLLCAWIIDGLDRKLADVIGYNIVENVTSHYREPSNLLHSMFCASYFFSYISLSLSSTLQLPMFWSKRMKRTCSRRGQLEQRRKKTREMAAKHMKTRKFFGKPLPG